MKRHPYFVCGALAGMTILHFTAFAQTARADSIDVTGGTSVASQTTGQSPKEKLLKACEDEWRADREAMMKRGMTRDFYVEQCSVRDDVPPIPAKPQTAPPAAPK